MLLITPHPIEGTLKAQPACDDDDNCQPVIAPSARVKLKMLSCVQEISPEVNWFTLTGKGLGYGTLFPNVPVTRVVSKPNVTEPVKLVPNTTASAAALGLGTTVAGMVVRSRMLSV